MRSKLFVPLLAAGLLLPLAACTSDNAHQAVNQGDTFTFVSPGGQTVIRYDAASRKPLKPLSGQLLMDESKTISVDDFPNQIVVLNSWGQWCAPCRSESDDLQRVQEEMQSKGYGTILGINVQDYNPEISRDFVKDNAITYPSIYDPPFKSALALGGVPTSVVPTTIVLDKQHRPAVVFLKEITDKELLDVVNELAAQ